MFWLTTFHTCSDWLLSTHVLTDYFPDMFWLTTFHTCSDLLPFSHILTDWLLSTHVELNVLSSWLFSARVLTDCFLCFQAGCFPLILWLFSMQCACFDGLHSRHVLISCFIFEWSYYFSHLFSLFSVYVFFAFHMFWWLFTFYTWSDWMFAFSICSVCFDHMVWLLWVLLHRYTSTSRVGFTAHQRCY